MARRKESRFAVSVLRPDAPPAKIVEREHEIRRPIQQFKSLPEQVAKSSVYLKNWYVPEIRERFKNFDRMKRIDMVFPYARLSVNGDKTEQLLVDLPKNENEVEQCVLKAKILKEIGYKYIWLQDDSTLFDALTQLGE